MKTNLLLIATFALGMFCANGFGQDQAANVFEQVERNPNRTLYNSLPGQANIASTFARPRQDPLAVAVNDLKNAENDEDKSKAQQKIRELLEKQYDAYLEQNQKQLDEMYDRLKRLEEQVEKRRDAKEEMVDLKLKMMVSQAEGLGWPGDQPNHRVTGFFTTPNSPPTLRSGFPAATFPAPAAQAENPAPASRPARSTGRSGR